MNASSQTTINKWLQAAQTQLKAAGVDSYPLDSLLLIEYVTGFNKAHILGHLDKNLSQEEQNKLNVLLERRVKREPMAYISGVKEFYGRDFCVDKNVLIPRPESESFIELLKKHKITHQTVIDVGSGSGILGITTSLELPTNQVTLVDIDGKALEIAKKNARVLHANCKFIQNDLLPTNNNYSVVLANLPYVPKTMNVEPELGFEPSVALFADDNGLGLYIRLWYQIGSSKSCEYVLTECLKSQHGQMIMLAQEAQFELAETDGLVQLFKQR